MTGSNLSMPTQFEFTELEINGANALQIFMNIEIFENIFIGGVTGSISIFDSDSLSFIEENEIEFNEEIKFAFKDPMGNELRFEGLMNGIRDEMTKNQKKIYVIDFTSKSVRKNEMKFINKRFKDMTPEDIVKEMSNELEGSLDYGSGGVGSGEKLNWVAGNRKPLDVIKYVVNHGVTQGKTEYEGGDKEDGKASGTSGYLFWETLDGFRFCSMDDLVNEAPYDTHEDYNTRIATGGSMEEQCKGIIEYQFPKVGDYFEKLRSGAFKSNLISFNLDTGILTNFKYEADDKVATKKQIDYAEDITRNMLRLFSNEKFTQECKKAIQDHGDQSRKFLPQTITRQNTFSDTQGRMTLPPQYGMKAGDHIKVKIANMKLSDSDPSKDSKKHSGTYLISQIGHHIFRDGRSYTKVAVIRTTNQQNEDDTQ